MAERTGLRCEFATGLWARMRGLLDDEVCGHGEILLLAPCKSIHTFGMREALDVAFLDRQGHVLRARRGVPPRRLLSCQKAVCVLERRHRPGAPWVEAGDTINLLIKTAEGEAQ